MLFSSVSVGEDMQARERRKEKKSGFANMESSLLVKSYTSKINPINNGLTKVATVEKTGKV